MDELVVFKLGCGGCRKGFVVCRPDYRGQGYCNDACRELEQAALRRLRNARHQRSDEGRQDHAAHQRTAMARKHAEDEAMTDAGRQKVAPRAEWSAPDDPIPLAESATEAGGTTDADDLQGSDSPVSDQDARARHRWSRRAAASGLAIALAAAVRAGDHHVPREPGAVVEREASRCVVCGREGSRVLSRPDRRAGRWRAFVILRCRGP
jgi:hypothetical protein